MNNIQNIPIIRKSGLYKDYGYPNQNKDTLYFATDVKRIYYNGVDYTNGANNLYELGFPSHSPFIDISNITIAEEPPKDIVEGYDFYLSLTVNVLDFPYIDGNENDNDNSSDFLSIFVKNLDTDKTQTSTKLKSNNVGSSNGYVHRSEIWGIKQDKPVLDWNIIAQYTDRNVGMVNGSYSQTVTLCKELPTMEEVDNRIKNIIGTAPSNLDTLQEIAEYLTDDTVEGGLIKNLGKKLDKTEAQDLYQPKGKYLTNVDAVAGSEVDIPGTPSITSTIVDETTTKLTFNNLKGETGATPNIDATATVDNNTGIPEVTVTKSGTKEDPNFAFDFKNLKGPKGDKGDPGQDGKDAPEGIYLPLSGGAMENETVVSKLNADMLDGNHSTAFFQNSLGTIADSDILTTLPGNRSGSYRISHVGWDGSAYVLYAASSNSGLAFYRMGGSNTIPNILTSLDSKNTWTDRGTILTSTTGNAVSSSKLNTSRTLWGQNFNGESNVSGNMTGVGSISMNNTISTTRADKDVDLGLSVTSDGRTTNFINGKSGNRGIYDATNQRWAFTIATDGNTHLLGGNVGIGTTTITTGCKLDVNGATKLRSYVLIDDAVQTAKGVTVNRTDINKDINSTAYWYGLGLGDISNGVTLGGYYGLKMFTNSGKYTILENGRHGVNTDTPSCTFDVNGDCHAKRYNTDKVYWSDEESVITPNSGYNGQVSLGKSDGRWKNIYTNGLDITSTTRVENLNADYLDGLHSTSFARTDETPQVDINTYKKRAGFVTTNMNSQATAARNYPIQEAGSLIYCESANDRSNQIYGTYNTNRWYVRGAGINNYTSWRELEPVDGFLTTIDASNLDPDTWYPVTIQLNGSMRTRITIQGNSTGNTNATWISRQDKGFSLSISWISIGSSWGWMYDQTTMRVIDQLSWGAGAETKPVRGIGQITSSSHEYVYIRGGAKYRFWTSNSVPVVLRSTAFTSNDTTIAPVANSNVGTLPEINLTHVYAEGNRSQKITGHKTFTGGYIKIENSLFLKEAGTTTTDGIYLSPQPNGNLILSHHKNYGWQKNLGTFDTDGNLGMTGNITASGALKSSEYVELRGSKGYGYLSVKKDDTTSSMPIDFGIGTDNKSFIDLNTDKAAVLGSESVEIKSPTIKIGQGTTDSNNATIYQSSKVIPVGNPVSKAFSSPNNGSSSTYLLSPDEPITNAAIVSSSIKSLDFSMFENLKEGITYTYILSVPAVSFTISFDRPLNYNLVINDVLRNEVFKSTTEEMINVKLARTEGDCIMKITKSYKYIYIELITNTTSIS